MVQQPLKVRRAEQDDIAYIVDLSRRVQEKLTALGSLQQIGPIPRETVEAQVNAGTAHYPGWEFETTGQRVRRAGDSREPWTLEVG